MRLFGHKKPSATTHATMEQIVAAQVAMRADNGYEVVFD